MAFLLIPRNWKERSKWVCFLLVVLSILAEIVNTILIQRRQNTLIVSNIYILCDSLLTFYFFYWKFKRQRSYNYIIFTCLITLLVTWSYHTLIKSDIKNLDSWSNGVETIAVIILSVIFFYDQLIKPQTLFVYSTAIFWIVAGILIYKTGTFFLFLYFDTLEHTETANFGNLYIINSAFLIIRSILFSIAFIMKKNDRKKRSNFKPVF